eukprot:10088762-Alexandrium_andersonii.AAC.1
MAGLPPLGAAAKGRVERWAAERCVEWSFPPGGFTGTLREAAPAYNVQCTLLTRLKAWGVQKPARSGWLQLLEPLAGTASPPPPAPAKRRLSEAEKKAKQRAAKKQRLWEAEERRLFDRAPRSLVEGNERVAMFAHDEVEQPRARERTAMEACDSDAPLTGAPPLILK